MTDNPGRPTVMTIEVVEKICERLASGESLRSICRDNDMPAMSTVMLAVVYDRDGFSEHYMRAREAAGFSHADMVVDLATRATDGEIDPNAARAAMTGMIWAAERMAPKKHSPRQDINHQSDDGSMTPRKIEIVAKHGNSED